VELIFIHEDEVKTKINKFEYGGIWHYIPLRSIVSVSLEGQVKNLITLSFHLFPNGHLKKVFESSKKYELEQLRNKIQELIEH
jgi:hypothetical protein